MENLIADFKNFDLTLLKKYERLLSTKTEDARLFPPYIPFVGKRYETYRVLIYATAQNIPQRIDEFSLRKRYSENFDKLVERLYYSFDFKRKYPNDRLNFSEVAIGPYQGGVLPALAGVFIYTVLHQPLKDFETIQDHIAISNYYKFSLHNKRDINPNNLESHDKYWELNDELVSRELKVFKPSYVITFKGRHVQFLEKQGFAVKIINDPAWILKGARGCLRLQGSWWRKVAGIRNPELTQIIENYLNDLQNPYKGKKEAVKTYLLKYHLDWQNDR